MIAIKSYTQIGYHRVSDDSVTSFAVPDSGVPAILAGLMESWDIDKIWTRDKEMNVNWYHDKTAITPVHIWGECPKENCPHHI